MFQFTRRKQHTDMVLPSDMATFHQVSSLACVSKQTAPYQKDSHVAENRVREPTVSSTRCNEASLSRLDRRDETSSHASPAYWEEKETDGTR